MPMLKFSPDTMRLVRTQRPPGYQSHRLATRLEDGWILVPVDDEVTIATAHEWVRGESDDGVVLRILHKVGRS